MATKRVSHIPPIGAPGPEPEFDLSHIPTLPFGTKEIGDSPVAKSPPPEKEIKPFRFVGTPSPTGMRQELMIPAPLVVPVEKLFDTEPPARDYAATVRNASTDAPDSGPVSVSALPIRSNWRLLLGAFVVAVFALTLVVWLGDSGSPKAATRPSAPVPAGQRVTLGSPRLAAVMADSEPVAPIDQSPSTLAAPTGIDDGATIPVVASASSAQQLNAASRAPNATTHRQLPAGALATLKKKSVLSTVLAPRPAD